MKTAAVAIPVATTTNRRFRRPGPLAAWSNILLLVAFPCFSLFRLALLNPR